MADVFRIVGYISQENRLAAERVARDLILAGDSLAALPSRGRRGRPGTRELVVVSPYVIVYEIDPIKDVQILRVWHGAQDRP